MQDSSLQRISGAASLLKIRNGQLVQSKEFVARVQLACALQDELDGFWKDVKDYMEGHDITESEGKVLLKLNPQRRLYGDKTVKPQFLKNTVDTKQVRAWQDRHNGKLPKGVKEVVSNRLVKKVIEE